MSAILISSARAVSESSPRSFFSGVVRVSFSLSFSTVALSVARSLRSAPNRAWVLVLQVAQYLALPRI